MNQYVDAIELEKFKTFSNPLMENVAEIVSGFPK